MRYSGLGNFKAQNPTPNPVHWVLENFNEVFIGVVPEECEAPAYDLMVDSGIVWHFSIVEWKH